MLTQVLLSSFVLQVSLLSVALVATGHGNRTPRRTYSEVLVRFPERLQTDDGMHVFRDIGWHAGGVLSGSVCQATLCGSDHVNCETLFALIHAGLGIDASVVFRDMGDFVSLALEPRRQFLDPAIISRLAAASPFAQGMVGDLR